MSRYRSRLLALVCFVALAFVLLASKARADNLADEAELQFALGADKYRAADFRGALEHFLASNRLVANRNVVFNIARTYEQLKQAPEAYRYYTQALEGETDAAGKSRVSEALARIAPLVAVLRVTTEPPGATVFLERKDLGPRGNAPLALGVKPGDHHVFVELPGYEPAEVAITGAELGAESPIRFVLKQILGTARIDGEPRGAAVRVDSEEAPATCTIPCDLPLPPGRHTLFVSKPGYQTTGAGVNVTANTVGAAHIALVAVTGSLVIDSDVKESVILIDGETRGFTPAVLAIPVGTHTIRLTQTGFRPYDATAIVAAGVQTRIDATMVQRDEVTAASRSTESVEDAPSSVSIIPREELRAMGYPTIADALRGIRGVYLSDDTSYRTAGFRGFSRAGDYGNRVLVLVDGQPTNDNYVGSSYIGFDGRVDIDDVDRIEVVRGPGSVLYGTGAFFGVINLVTRGRDAQTHGELAIGAVDRSVGRGRATAYVRFSPDAGAWTSVAGAHGAGSDFFFREYASDPATGGNARGVDGFDAGTVNGRVWYKALTAQWLLTSRKKTLPSGVFATLFGDPRNHFADTRALFEARFEPVVSPQLQVLSRAHINLYNFDDFLAYLPADGGPTTEGFRGQWLGLEQRFVYTPLPAVRVTAGGEYQRHYQTAQTGSNDQGTYLSRDDPFSIVAGYVVGDLTPNRIFKVSAGARADYYSNFGASLNPRVAVILHPYEQGTVKVLGGKAFRAPSVYEHYYTGATQIPSVDLKPEQVYSGEVELTHRFSTTVSGVIAGYTNHVTNLIILGGGGTASDPNQYVNSTAPIETNGLELEVRRDWRQGWMFGASYSLQHSRYLNNADGALREVPNSPEHLASIKGAVPILGRTLVLMSRLSLEGPRFDKYDQSGDPPQGKTDGAAIWDVVLSGEAEKYGVRYALGIYNAADSRYSVPVSREFTQATIVQHGRSLLASSTLTF